MPCRTGLEDEHFNIEKWKTDQYINNGLKAELLWFRTPLASLTCEAMRIIEEKELIEQCSPELKEWWIEHKRRDSGDEISQEEKMKNLAVWYDRIPDFI